MTKGKGPARTKVTLDDLILENGIIKGEDLLEVLLKTRLDRIVKGSNPSRPASSFSIESITLDGFGPHDGPNKLKIIDGLTLLTGENGTGKTHVMLAVHWCLFGERGSLDPWMSETDPLGKDLVNWERRSKGKRNMSVEVIFEWAGSRYHAVRRLEGNKEEFSLENISNRAKVEGGTPSGLTPDILPYLVFQGEAVMFLASEDPFLREGNLKDVIRTLSGASDIGRMKDLLEQARSILIERIKSLKDAALPKEQELLLLEVKHRSVKDRIEKIKTGSREISDRKKRALSDYRKALKELSGLGMVTKEDEQKALAKAKAPLIREELKGMLSGAGREILRKMTRRAMDRCFEERENRIKSRMMFGALESQAAIVRNIMETGNCLCGTSIGRTGMGRENIKALLLRLEARRDELKELAAEPIWTSDQVLEGARKCLAYRSFDRGHFLKTVRELRNINWNLSKEPVVDREARLETLIEKIRQFEKDSALLEREREELGRTEVERKEVERQIKRTEGDLVKLWGVKGGDKKHTDLLDILDVGIEDMVSSIDRIMEDMREEVEDRSNTTLLELDRDGKLGEIRIHPTNYRIGRIINTEDGERTLPMAYLSAGERELMALSVLSSIPGISNGMLMLDSPFPYIDSAKRSRIIEGLPLISKKVFISLPEGTFTEREIKRAKDIWTEQGGDFKHYRLDMKKGGSKLSDVGGGE